jgi:hypothetical protein
LNKEVAKAKDVSDKSKDKDVPLPTARTHREKQQHWLSNEEGDEVFSN